MNEQNSPPVGLFLLALMGFRHLIALAIILFWFSVGVGLVIWLLSLLWG